MSHPEISKIVKDKALNGKTELSRFTIVQNNFDGVVQRQMGDGDEEDALGVIKKKI